MTSDAARWGPDAPTPAQLKEFFDQVKSGRITKESLQAFLRYGVGAARQVHDFSVWKTVKLGTGLTTADDFRKALKMQRYKIGNWANDILGQPAFTASATATEIDLVKVSVAELGFEGRARYDEICARAQEFGLELCPNEVGPQLRLQYPDQPFCEWLVVAMEPISDSGGLPNVWHVERVENGLWLEAGCSDPAGVWHSDLAFLFCRPRK